MNNFSISGILELFGSHLNDKASKLADPKLGLQFKQGKRDYRGSIIHKDGKDK